MIGKPIRGHAGRSPYSTEWMIAGWRQGLISEGFWFWFSSFVSQKFREQSQESSRKFWLLVWLAFEQLFVGEELEKPLLVSQRVEIAVHPDPLAVLETGDDRLPQALHAFRLVPLEGAQAREIVERGRVDIPSGAVELVFLDRLGQPRVGRLRLVAATDAIEQEAQRKEDRAAVVFVVSLERGRGVGIRLLDEVLRRLPLAQPVERDHDLTARAVKAARPALLQRLLERVDRADVADLADRHDRQFMHPEGVILKGVATFRQTELIIGLAHDPDQDRHRLLLPELHDLAELALEKSGVAAVGHERVEQLLDPFLVVEPQDRLRRHDGRIGGLLLDPPFLRGLLDRVDGLGADPREGVRGRDLGVVVEFDQEVDQPVDRRLRLRAPQRGDRLLPDLLALVSQREEEILLRLDAQLLEVFEGFFVDVRIPVLVEEPRDFHERLLALDGAERLDREKTDFHVRAGERLDEGLLGFEPLARQILRRLLAHLVGGVVHQDLSDGGGRLLVLDRLEPLQRGLAAL